MDSVLTNNLWIYLLFVCAFFALHVYTFPSAIDFFVNSVDPEAEKNNKYPVE